MQPWHPSISLHSRDHLDLVVCHYGVFPAPLDVLDYPGEHLVGVAGVVADAGYAKGTNLPAIVVINLGDGHVESALDSSDY